jgi:thiol-disulfide isomerase/thioredoxin
MATETTKGGGQRNKPNARARAAAAREAQRKRETRRKMMTVGGITVVVLAIVAVMVIIFVTKSDKKNSASRTVASPAIVKQLTTIPAATFQTVGAGNTTGGPAKVSGTPLTAGGKPVFFYYGAEYCPFCATERWAVVTALGRFGTWSNLQQTTSASQDTPPSIPTFSFYGAKFSSPYFAFQSVETYTNQQSGSFYSTLETPTKAQQALVQKYDGANGSIPFLDFGNKYTSSGATYDYSVLQGKAPDEIAANILDPTTATSKGVLGAANSITAALCEMTSGQPGSVCNAPEIKTLRAALTAKK